MKQAYTNNLAQAKDLLLANETYTCVLKKEDDCQFSQEHGVLPLMQWIDAGKHFKGYAAADRIVGSAAAYLYILLDVREVYAQVMSQGAIEILSQHGITAIHDVTTATIRNRANTGSCPMELAVQNSRTSEEAYDAIRRKLHELQSHI